MSTKASGISLKDALRVIEAATAQADSIGVAMNIAVIDAGANLTAFQRQDGAWLGSIAVAHAKAYTARAFDMPTAELQSMVQPDEPLYGIEASDPGRIAAFPGGIPLKGRRGDRGSDRRQWWFGRSGPAGGRGRRRRTLKLNRSCERTVDAPPGPVCDSWQYWT